MTAATSVLGSRASPRRFALPGFALTLGFTLAYFSLIVLIPLAGVFLKAAGLGWEGIEQVLTSPRVLAALKLSFGTAFIAALINAVFGLLVAWVFVRYVFPGKRLFDAMIDLLFALPNRGGGHRADGAVFRQRMDRPVPGAAWHQGRLRAARHRGGAHLHRSAVRGSTVEPVLQDAERELKEAAASLGANRWQTVTRIIFPTVLPALLTGFALAFARGVGEYGSVIFIAGNLPLV